MPRKGRRERRLLAHLFVAETHAPYMVRAMDFVRHHFVHPGYGPCDGFGNGGGCSVCQDTDAEVLARADDLDYAVAGLLMEAQESPAAPGGDGGSK